MHKDKNLRTQKQFSFKNFNNWDVLVEGWYITLESKELKRGAIKPFQIGKQKIVLYRGESERVYALDAFCPHMGTDLAIGKVKGEDIECFFHHWCFNGKGQCTSVPALKAKAHHARLQSYATSERYGFIWVFPAAEADDDVLVPSDLEGKELVFSHDPPNYAHTHHHISMINGLDAQHLSTVHGIKINMDLKTEERAGRISFTLSGKTPSLTWKDRLTKRLIGPSYSYSMTYSRATVAALTLMRNVYFLKPKWVWPRLYMLYAYRPLPDKRSLTIPIYVTEKGNTFFQQAFARIRIMMTRLSYYSLKDEDQIIYDNIRFNPENLIARDAPLTRYFRYVEELRPSVWSEYKESNSLTPARIFHEEEPDYWAPLSKDKAHRTESPGPV